MENSKRSQEIEEEIRSISPGLSGLSRRKNSEDLPFRYFEKLPDQVIYKLGQRSATERTGWVQWLINQWYGRRMMLVSMASLLTVIFATGLWFITAQPTPAMDFSQINPLEARSYLISNAGDLDDAQLSLLNDQEFGDEFMPVTDEELKGVIDDYLYQLPSENQLN
jgi:hypothetical protein